MKQILVGLMLFAMPCFGETNYYFKVKMPEQTLRGWFTSTVPYSLYRSDILFLVSVTQAQYGAGGPAAFAALPAQVVTDGIKAAYGEKANIDTTTRERKADMLFLMIEVNKLRALLGKALRDNAYIRTNIQNIAENPGAVPNPPL